MGIESEGDVRGASGLEESLGGNLFNSGDGDCKAGDGQIQVAVDVGAVGEFLKAEGKAVLHDGADTNADIGDHAVVLVG